MSLPKSSSAYPRAYLDAIETAHNHGELFIPHSKPLALRLQLQGLRGALRRENAADLIDALVFKVKPDGLLLQMRDSSDDANAVQNALAAFKTSAPTLPDSPRTALDADAALNRILGNI